MFGAVYFGEMLATLPTTFPGVPEPGRVAEMEVG